MDAKIIELAEKIYAGSIKVDGREVISIPERGYITQLAKSSITAAKVFYEVKREVDR